MAEDNILMSMRDWADQTDNFLKLNRREVLDHKGTISREQALEKTSQEYEKFRMIQDRNYLSDFDKLQEELSKYERKES